MAGMTIELDPQQQAARGARGGVNTAEDLDFIDIPTFLRRQAD